MCYAILEVKYRAANQPEILKIADVDALDTRLHALQNSEQVERITIFKPECVLRRQTTWTTENPPDRPVPDTGDHSEYVYDPRSYPPT